MNIWWPFATATDGLGYLKSTVHIAGHRWCMAETKRAVFDAFIMDGKWMWKVMCWTCPVSPRGQLLRTR